MRNLIDDNYDSIVSRGLITNDTTHHDFIDKIKEEVMEVELAVYNRDRFNLKEELADVILTTLNYARHFNIDIEHELKNKIQINKNRQ